MPPVGGRHWPIPASENRQFSSPSPGMLHPMTEALDHERCYRAVAGRDARFDGWFFTAVAHDRHLLPPLVPGAHAAAPATSPSSPPPPRRRRPGSAPAAVAGPTPCPGSPAVGRPRRRRRPGHAADRRRRGGAQRRRRAWPPGSATPSASCTACSSAELGVGPLALARAQRAQTARLLIETTDLPMADVAFAAGFASIRQFNDTVREVFATTPSGAARRETRRGDGGAPAG